MNKIELPEIGYVKEGLGTLTICLPIPVSKNRMFASVNGRIIHTNDARKFYNDVQMMFFGNRTIRKFTENMSINKGVILRIKQVFFTNNHRKDVSGMFVSLYDGLEKITGINDNLYYPDYTECVYTKEEERVLVTMVQSMTKYYDSKEEMNHVSKRTKTYP